MNTNNFHVPLWYSWWSLPHKIKTMIHKSGNVIKAEVKTTTAKWGVSSGRHESDILHDHHDHHHDYAESVCSKNGIVSPDMERFCLIWSAKISREVKECKQFQRGCSWGQLARVAITNMILRDDSNAALGNKKLQSMEVHEQIRQFEVLVKWCSWWCCFGNCMIFDHERKADNLGSWY